MTTIGRRIPIYDQQVAVGETVQLDLQIKDPLGVIFNLTGYTASYAVADQRGTVVITSVPSVVANTISLRCDIDAPAVRAGNYQHELRIQPADGPEVTLFQGTLKVLSRLAGFA